MKAFLIAAIFLGLFFSQAVIAERADSDKPIHLEADRATVEDIKRKDAARISVFTGNVKLTQGTLRIQADKVIIKEDLDGFRYATAFGDLVSFRQKREGLDEFIEGWSKRVEYDNKSNKIELFRKAHLKRGSDEVRGDYISYDMDTEFFQVIGGNGGDAESNADGRVRIIIQPKKKSDKTNDATVEP